MNAITSVLAIILGPVVALHAVSQGISARDLEAKLGAEVSRWAHDGRLSVLWPFKTRDELRAFEREGTRPRIATDGGLALKVGGEVRLRELTFQAPCRIAFEVNLEKGTEAPFLAFIDGDDQGIKTAAFVNARISEESGRRFHGAFLSRHEKPEFSESFSRSEMAPGVRLAVSFSIAAGGMEMQVGAAKVWQQRDWPHKRFRLAVGALEGTPVVRNLRIEGQVVLESMRKFVSSLQAEKEAPKARAGTYKGDLASEKIAEEMAADDGVSAACQAAFDELPESIRRRQEHARKALDEGDLAGARNALERCLQDYPESPVLHWSLGRILGFEGRTDAAIEAFRAATARTSRIPEPFHELGRLLLDAGNPEEAGSCLAKARDLEPADPWIHLSLALLHLANVDLDAAEKELGEARAMRPASKGLKLYAEDIGRLRSEPRWSRKPHRVEKGAYVVEGDIAAQDVAAIATKLLYYRRFLESAFPHGVKQKQPCRVWIFDSEEAYHVFGDTFSHREDHSLGQYQPLIRTLLLFSKVSPKETQEVLFHEAFHQWLDVAVHHAPAWFNEGLAEYYGATMFDASWKPVEGGLQPGRLGHLRTLLDERPLVPFRDLMLMTHDRFMDGDSSLHYAQSWAMVHWFLRGGHAAAGLAFRTYRDAVHAGRSLQACYDASFGAHGAPSLDALQAAFLGYLKGI